MTIIHADILEWAASYDGPLFHALLCDAPYEMEFMGKGWDNSGVAFNPETWKAIARCLHPGAFLFVFAGTINDDLISVAMRQAGLRKYHRAGAWVYGCLSDDTEILTSNGWERYHKSIVQSDVMCYNPDTEALEWHRVQELVAYDYDETAYRIHSDRTDQLVSRNHRCLVRRGDRWVFEYAERLAPQEVVPILENMPELRRAVRRDECQSVSEKVLFSKMRERSGAHGITSTPATHAQAYTTSAAQGQGDRLFGVRQASVEARCMAAQGQNAELFNEMQWRTTLAQPRQIFSQWQRQKTAGQRIGGRAQSGMEGRRNLFQETRQLQGREVCPLPGRIQQHGSQGWLCDGAPAIRRSGVRSGAAALGSGTSYRPQSGQQQSEQPATVRQQPRSQALRASRITTPDLATVTPVHYRGKVWCVRVPTGAFVARRNGKIFITGNSGFPKAARLDTVIDRRAGIERTKVGSRKHQPKFDAKGFEYRKKDNGYNSKDRETFDVTKPATALAETWAGHRYGGQMLKPAFESILIFQKPYEGDPVSSITRTGAGALWIDGGRIGTADDTARNRAPNRGAVGFGRGVEGMGGDGHPDGRWPANLVLSHHPACDLVGTRRVKGTNTPGQRATGAAKVGSVYSGGWGDDIPNHYNDADGMETIAAWDCHPDCAVRRLGEQSGERSNGGPVSENTPYKDSPVRFTQGLERRTSDSRFAGDTGTAARFFFQADYMAERLEDSDQVIYEAKSSRAEREAGLDPRQVRLLSMAEIDEQESSGIYGNETEEGAAPRGRRPRHRVDRDTNNDGPGTAIAQTDPRGRPTRRNVHPTIKPIALARHLATLLLPPDLYAPRRLLVPFAGAGSECIGALLAGWEEVIGVELEEDHCRIASARIAYWQQRRHEFLDPSKPITATLSDAPDGQRDMFGDDL